MQRLPPVPEGEPFSETSRACQTGGPLSRPLHSQFQGVFDFKRRRLAIFFFARRWGKNVRALAVSFTPSVSARAQFLPPSTRKLSSQIKTYAARRRRPREDHNSVLSKIPERAHGFTLPAPPSSSHERTNIHTHTHVRTHRRLQKEEEKKKNSSHFSGRASKSVIRGTYATLPWAQSDTHFRSGHNRRR